MGFEAEHETWLQEHMKRRTGERLDALRRGHGYGNWLFVERIWWPLVGHFDGLHPEYEVKDWRGRSYYADFGSHGTDRTKYRMDLNRGLFLQSQGYLLYYIALDEMKENPAFILSSLRSILGPYLSVIEGGALRAFSKIERDLMRAAVRHDRVIRPTEVARELELHPMTVIKYCRILAAKGKFRAIAKGSSGRITSYEYVGSLLSPDLV